MDQFGLSDSAYSPYFLCFNSVTHVTIACIPEGSYLSQDIDWRYRTTYGYTATNWRKM
jgi:hypothetical protein